MSKFVSKLAVTALAASILATGTPPRQVAAQSQGTITTLLAAAAIIGGIVLYDNYVHKKQAANAVVGYTRNGGTIYGDGRIVMPNGQSIYPNSNGQYPWGQYAYYQPQANTTEYAYDYQRTGQYDQTQRHGQYRTVQGNTNVHTNVHTNIHTNSNVHNKARGNGNGNHGNH
jgi:hypothetical protein